MIARCSPDLSQLLYLSLFGGSARDEFRGVDVASNGDVAYVGLSESSDFMTRNAYDTTLDADTANPDQGIIYLILAAP